MKAKITKTRFIEEYENKYGQMFLHAITYDEKEALYSSKAKNQTNFIEGQECEFTETSKTNDRGETVFYVRPIQQNSGNFSRQMKREQSKYSGFAMAYAKDMAVAGLIGLDDIERYCTAMFNKMVALDKTLES